MQLAAIRASNSGSALAREVACVAITNELLMAAVAPNGDLYILRREGAGALVRQARAGNGDEHRCRQ